MQDERDVQQLCAADRRKIVGDPELRRLAELLAQGILLLVGRPGMLGPVAPTRFEVMFRHEIEIYADDSALPITLGIRQRGYGWPGEAGVGMEGDNERSGDL